MARKTAPEPEIVEMPHRYSGSKSLWFWGRIKNPKMHKIDRNRLYALGVVLQNLESSVLHDLLTVETALAAKKGNR